MKYIKISILIKTGENIPYFIGSQIRGAFGYALKKVTCINPSYQCEECFAIEATIWKSKLNYSFYRNMDQKYLPLFNILNTQIEQNPKETKMFLSEFIYKRRKV